MRLGTVFLALLVAAGAGGAILIVGGQDEPPPLVAKARGSFGQAEHVTLEKAADYWLASGKEKKGRLLSGAGPLSLSPSGSGARRRCAAASSPFHPR
jgi:hypothetical protein